MAFFSKIIFLSVLTLGIQHFSFGQVGEGVLKTKKNSIKISPTAFAVSTFAISYERYITTGISLQISGGYMSASKNLDNSNSIGNTLNPTSNTNNYNNGYNSNYNNNGYYTRTSNVDKAHGKFIEGMLKFYFLKGKSVMSGLYFAPYGRYGKNTFDINKQYVLTNTNTQYPYTAVPAGPTSFKYDIESYEGGAVFGFQLVAGNAFVMDMYLGGGLKNSTNTAPTTYQKSDRTFSILESQDYTGITPKAGLRIGFVF